MQERELYSRGEKDAKYVDLAQMEDPFPDNPGVKLGSFVEAKTGKGLWIYVALEQWRQVPAETGDAYQLLANLISLPKAPAAPVAARPAAPVKKSRACYPPRVAIPIEALVDDEWAEWYRLAPADR